MRTCSARALIGASAHRARSPTRRFRVRGILRFRTPGLRWSHALHHQPFAGAGAASAEVRSSRRGRIVIATPAIIGYASSLAGTPVTVTCNRDQSFDKGTLGYTLYDAQGVVYPTIYLPASTCNRLNKLAAPGRLVVTVARKGRTLAATAGDGDGPSRRSRRRHADPRGHAHPRAVHRRGAGRVRLLPQPLERRQAVPPLRERGSQRPARNDRLPPGIRCGLPHGLLIGRTRARTACAAIITFCVLGSVTASGHARVSRTWERLAA